MPKISESSVEVLYNEFDNFGKRITEGFKRIETTEESIWSINPKWRGLFYGILSICGVAVSVFTLFAKWCDWSPNTLLAVFNEIGKEFLVRSLSFGLRFKWQIG